MEDNGVKVREAKEEKKKKQSAEQIRDKKQDIKFDVRDYPINYLVGQYEQQEFYIPLEYQRNFVWKEGHQQEFIRTILLGYPCPEIFTAEGERDLETHKKYMHVIDGQQRLTTIKRFLDNELQVDNRYYRDLSIEEQSNVSNYELGTVILRLNPEQDIKEIEEIFRRLNRNNYSLNETEKQISRLSDNEYMLLARLFSGDLILNYGDSDADVEDTEDTEIDENIIRFKENPFITPEFKEWALNKDFSNINNFFLSNEIYSDIQIKDNTTTKDIGDMMCIILNKEFHSRRLNEDESSQNTGCSWSNRNKIFNFQ